MTRGKLWWIPVFVILLDQATKLRIKQTMELFDSVSVIGDFFRITYVRNHGGLFSLSFGDSTLNRLIFTIATFIILFIIVILIIKTGRKLPLIAYFLVLGGGIGNLIDRVAWGYVIDFLDFDFFDIIMQRWPVFNIADSAITIAIFLLIIDVLFFIESPGNKLTE